MEENTEIKASAFDPQTIWCATCVLPADRCDCQTDAYGNTAAENEIIDKALGIETHTITTARMVSWRDAHRVQLELWSLLLDCGALPNGLEGDITGNPVDGFRATVKCVGLTEDERLAMLIVGTKKSGVIG